MPVYRGQENWGTGTSPDTRDYRGIQRYRGHPRYPSYTLGQDLSITGAPGHLPIPGITGNTKVPGSSPVPRLQTGARLLHYWGTGASPDTGEYRGTGDHPRYPGYKPGQYLSITGVYRGTGVNPDTTVTNRGITSPLPGYRGISRYRGYRGIQRYWGLPRSTGYKPGRAPVPRLQT